MIKWKVSLMVYHIVPSTIPILEHQCIYSTTTTSFMGKELPSTETPPKKRHVWCVGGQLREGSVGQKVLPRNPTSMASRSQPLEPLRALPIQYTQRIRRSFGRQPHLRNPMKISVCFTDVSEIALFSDGAGRASLQLTDNVVG